MNEDYLIIERCIAFIYGVLTCLALIFLAIITAWLRRKFREIEARRNVEYRATGNLPPRLKIENIILRK